MTLRDSTVAALTALAFLVTACDHKSSATQDASAVPPAIAYEAHVPAANTAPVGGKLENPHKGDAQIAQTGAGLFSQMNCDGCHGGGGTGWEGPSLADGRWRYGGGDGEIFTSIFYGRPKGMPAYGGVLGQDGVWTLVTYLQSLPVPDAVPTQSYEATEESKQAVKEATPPASAPAAPPATTQSAGGTPEEMIAKYGCVACHSLDRKVIGPSLKEVAGKYRGQADAKAKLVAKVKNGGSGVWGNIPMPANAAVPDQDLDKLVDWVLSLK
jgi:cytochrome c551/c552